MLSSSSEFSFNSNQLLNASRVQKTPSSVTRQWGIYLKLADWDSVASCLSYTSFSKTQVYLLSSLGSFRTQSGTGGKPSLHVARIQFLNAKDSLELKPSGHQFVSPMPFSHFLPDHSTADNTSRHSPPGSSHCPRFKREIQMTAVHRRPWMLPRWELKTQLTMFTICESPISVTWWPDFPSSS